jgi:hypothetical protein
LLGNPEAPQLNWPRAATNTLRADLAEAGARLETLTPSG